jgi:nucleoside-diphosphate-sugar epimerase
MSTERHPNQVRDLEQLEEMLSEPSEAAVEAMGRVEGDVVVLGVAGKMGPSLARMVKRASEAAGVKRRVTGVARFSSKETERFLQAHGVETITADLLDQRQLDGLPEAPNVIYMAGMKFGSTGNESLTWAMNAYLPGMVCQKYRRSRIVAFSTGNVYGLVTVVGGGSVETDPLNPQGEYAMSCLGRERIFEHFSRTMGIPVSIIRLNYAVEMRYGVLVDIAQRVWRGEPVNAAMAFNVIWQADANAHAVASIAQAASPAVVFNVAGPEVLSVRRVAGQMASLMGKDPVVFEGAEMPDALLSNAQLSHRLFGYPQVSAQQLIYWIADWTKRGGATLNKPTHFETRDGKF